MSKEAMSEALEILDRLDIYDDFLDLYQARQPIALERVCELLRAAIDEPEKREPLSEEEIQTKVVSSDFGYLFAFKQGVRFAEKHHGIVDYR